MIESITFEELRAAMVRDGYYTPLDHALALFKNVEKHREHFEVREFYEDAKGRRFVYTGDELWPWIVLRVPADQWTFTSNPEGMHVTDSYPLRPLKKLVPEE